MAASAGFKQECPSCGAQVPIKDPKLVGKKTDCPICKFRFVVEEPPEEADEADDQAAAKKAPPREEQAITAKRPTGGPAPAASKAKSKGKPVQPVRRRGEEDDDDLEEEERPKPAAKAKSGANSVLLLGGGLAVVAVALLGVFGYMYFGKKEPARPTVALRTQRDGGEENGKDDKKEKKAIVPVSNLGEISNLLPNDTEAVLHCGNVAQLLNSPVGQSAFSTPGAFRKDLLDHTLGISLTDLEKVVVGHNSKDDWLFAVLRTTKPIDMDKVTKALDLKDGQEIEKQKYAVADVGDWLANMSRLVTGQAHEPAKGGEPRPLAVYRVNAQTLVLADVAPMQAFLKVKGQPEIRFKAPKKDENVPPDPDAKDNQPGPGFMTINPNLKTLLDRLESRPGALVTLAVDMASPKFQQRVEGLCTPFQVTVDQDLDAVGLTFQRSEEFTAFTAGYQLKKQEMADTLPDRIKVKAREIAWDAIFPRIKVVYLERRDQPIGPLGPDGKMIEPDKQLPIVTITSDKRQRTVWLSVECSPNSRVRPWLSEAVAGSVVRARGTMEMATGRPHLNALAAALRGYLAANDNKFPPGLCPRPIPVARSGRPWPPEEHVSWMALVLPYLGEEYRGVRAHIADVESWRKPENLKAGLVVVPAFLSAGSPPDSWWVRPPAAPDAELAQTHFVGIAGIGLDAARYRDGDTEVANLIGIFGYDRVTNLKGLKNPATTIAIAQVPPTFKRPWICGGGATIAGVPETESVKPFVCTKHNNTPGTYVIMADTSIRFVPETIPDKVFQAMCTRNGANPAEVDKFTTLIAGPAKAELKTVSK
jgi:uncharacterized Zn finger protein (UPF0148 family)